MLEEILKGNIQIVDYVEDWRESIKIAAKPLLEKGIIEKKYVVSIIKNIEKFGFYIVLGENLAMPHSRPENGVKKTGLSFLKLNKPVNYGENKINLIFILAAKDSETHINILLSLSSLFQNKESLENLSNLTSKEEIIKIFKKY